MHQEDRYILDRDSVRRVDRAAIEEYAIPGLVLMENAARGLAEVVLDGPGLFATPPRRVLIVCGKGNNGGDGYALARHLDNAGVQVGLVALGRPRPEGDAGINAAICRAMGIAETPLDAIDSLGDHDLIVDAIFGTGLDRAVTGESARAVAWINASNRPVLAVDVPSGLDCDTGRPLGPTVRARVTVTFVAMKPGFLVPEAADYVGTVRIKPIGAPVSLLRRFGTPRS